MKLSLQVSAALLLAGLVATVCGPSITADLSPDGKTIAQADQKGLHLRAVGDGSLRTILKGSVQEPQFSPDGRTIAVERLIDKGPAEAFLIDTATQQVTPLPQGLRSPFTWRPDGTELIGWRGNVGDVYHLVVLVQHAAVQLTAPCYLLDQSGVQDI